MAFQVAEKERGDVTVMELAGSLDTLAAEDLKTAFDQIQRSGRKRIILSLKKVNYIASSSIRVLLSVSKGLRQGQGELKIAEIPPNVHDVFRMVGLGNAIALFGSVSEALGSFR